MLIELICVHSWKFVVRLSAQSCAICVKIRGFKKDNSLNLFNSWLDYLLNHAQFA